MLLEFNTTLDFIAQTPLSAILCSFSLSVVSWVQGYLSDGRISVGASLIAEIVTIERNLFDRKM